MSGNESVSDQAELEEERRKREEKEEESERRYGIYLYEKQVRARKLMICLCVLCLVFMILVMATLRNPYLFTLDDDTQGFINQAFNSVVLLTIPFLLGGCGAIARLLLSGVRIVDELTLVGGSALMACFSWIGIKSGVLISIIAPHLSKHQISEEQVVSAPTSFYTMSLVAVLVGMFSTNLYLFISQRVDQISKEKISKTPR